MGIREMSAKFLLNRVAQAYGEIVDIQFNTVEKSISLEVLLKGESKTDCFQIFYAIESNALVIKKVLAKKEWHQAVADYLLKKDYKIPLQHKAISPILNFLF